MTDVTKLKFLKKNINDPNWLNTYKEEYNKQTNKRILAINDKNDTENLIIKLNDEINKQSQELRRLNYEYGASVSNIKKELYKDKQTNDNNLVLKIITFFQILVLVVLLLGMFNILNKLVLTILVVILYLFVIGVIVVKLNNDNGRDKFNYNEYKIEIKPEKVCNFKPKV